MISTELQNALITDIHELADSIYGEQPALGSMKAISYSLQDISRALVMLILLERIKILGE